MTFEVWILSPGSTVRMQKYVVLDVKTLQAAVMLVQIDMNRRFPRGKSWRIFLAADVDLIDYDYDVAIVLRGGDNENNGGD